MRPDMDGWEFLRIMKAGPALRQIPVFISSSKLLGPKIDGERFHYIIKPFSRLEHLDGVERELERHGKTFPPNEIRTHQRAHWQSQLEALVANHV